MKNLLLVVFIFAGAGAAYAADCCSVGAACCGRACCISKK